jgi:ABC-2 type transport system ATP-binding protein
MKTRVVQTPAGRAAEHASGMEVVIRAEGLSKHFGDVAALSSLDLAVTRNSIVGFLGPNGAGKTTAIKLLLGLARPTAGTARIVGLDTVRDSLAIRARVGYLAQDPRFYQYMTARQTLAFAARFFYVGPRREMRARIDDTLALVGLEGKADRPVKGFSGGERQRLGIAQAQVNHPDLLILDEPAAALDPVGRRDVLDVMMRLRDRTTIFYSTHILEDVERVSDHVAILDHGRLVADAPTARLLGDGAPPYEITVRGDGEAQVRRLARTPWVTATSHSPDGAETAITVTVSDDAAAESMLLPAVLSVPGTVVTAFGRKRAKLEEVFLQLVDKPRSSN